MSSRSDGRGQQDAVDEAGGRRQPQTAQDMTLPLGRTLMAARVVAALCEGRVPPSAGAWSAHHRRGTR